MNSTDDGFDERGIIASQLMALRQQIEALGAQVDAVLLVVAGPKEPTETCDHPLEQRRMLGKAMGDLRFTCLACQETVTPNPEE